MGKAYQNAAAFHTWHRSRTYEAADPRIDPWLRDVLVALQGCLYEMAKQVDSNTERLDRIESTLKRRG